MFPQTNNIFTELTVRENLEMGAFLIEGDINDRLNEMFDLFPIINEKKVINLRVSYQEGKGSKLLWQGH